MNRRQSVTVHLDELPWKHAGGGVRFFDVLVTMLAVTGVVLIWLGLS